MSDFSIIPSLAGGALIGLSAAVLLLVNRRVAGVSGIVGGLLAPERGDVAWRALFLLGLLAGGAVMAVVWPAGFAPLVDRSLGALLAAGFLVGFGSRVANGCTSGHGVCGVSRLSARSLVATITFMGSGALATWVTQHLLGGRL
jgi:uncharacterized membrane protein YedE/YeeE